MADKEIRFIDPHYNELFRIPDGGSVVMTRPEGEQYVYDCKYLDETHCALNGEIFHICQHAEIRQRVGATIAPEAEPEIVGGYRVRQRNFVGNQVFVLAHNPGAVQPWVTWQGRQDRPGNFFWGHYYDKRSDASTDLFRRTDAERRGMSYEKYKPPKPKDRGMEP
jgi:hypothetical protein